MKTTMMIWRDKNDCVWRQNPLVQGEFQILIEATQAWSDADLDPADVPFVGDCGVTGCRVCADTLYTVDDLVVYDASHHGRRSQ